MSAHSVPCSPLGGGWSRAPLGRRVVPSAGPGEGCGPRCPSALVPVTGSRVFSSMGFVSARSCMFVSCSRPPYCVSLLESARIGGIARSLLLACRFVNRVVTASDSVDTLFRRRRSRRASYLSAPRALRWRSVTSNAAIRIAWLSHEMATTVARTSFVCPHHGAGLSSSFFCFVSLMFRDAFGPHYLPSGFVVHRRLTLVVERSLGVSLAACC